MKTCKRKNQPLKADTALTLPSRIEQFCYRLRVRLPFAPSSRRYDITLCREKEFLWFRVPKVCTRTILYGLIESGVHLDAEHPFDVHYPVKEMAHYFKFAFVRNPWDRLVSCWHNKVVNSNLYNLTEMQRGEFSQFVSYVETLDLKTCDGHLRLQSELIDLNHLDFLGRYESFDDDFAYVLREVRIPDGNFVMRNVSDGKAPYQGYYETSALIDRVAKLYQKDINVFRYEFATGP